MAYFKCRLDPETFERIANTQPKPKITSLLELVEQAKKRVAEAQDIAAAVMQSIALPGEGFRCALDLV